jgi:hypothetical protein
VIKYLTLFNRVLDKKNIDLLAFPQMFKEIEPINTDANDEHSSYPSVAKPYINFLGLPEVVFPCGYYKSGAPFSLILIGRKWSQEKLLSCAYAFEQATKTPISPSLLTEVWRQALYILPLFVSSQLLLAATETPLDRSQVGKYDDK